MEDFQSKYSGEQVEVMLDQIASGEAGGGGGGITVETDPVFSASPAASITEAKKTEWDGKQNAIADLDAIRSGAEKGATALQSVPSEYVTDTELNNKGYATISALNDKVDKVSGKQLSTEDFTSALKTKLEGLSNYDDTEIENAITSLQTQFNTLVSGNASDAINSFNEIIAFLDGIADTEDLSSIIASIEQQIAGKMDKVTLAAVATSGSYNDLSNKPTIPSAVTESTVSGWGFTKNTGTYSKPSTGIPKSDLASAVQTSLGKADTALQSYTEQYKGTVTKVKINGSEKFPDSNGLVDLGTIEGGGSSSGGSISYPVVEIGVPPFSEGISPNIYYISTNMTGQDELYVTLNEPTDNSIVNEYVFEFYIEDANWGNSPALSLPDTIKWANDAAPVIEVNKTYVVSIVNNLAVFAEF